ncbi:MAG: thioesterase family protein [Frankiaceae bacterium]|jgi:hypothetical protein|nr:thioesterase family protein [Frankiaceae bacterium]
MPAYYERIGPHRYLPTAHAGGAWQPDAEQHMAPVAGLLAREIELFVAPRGGEVEIARISYDILGLIGAAESDIEVAALRPGRTIELVEATMIIGGRPAVRARAWLLSRQDTAPIAGGGPAPLPAPDSLPRWPMQRLWAGGYIASLDVRREGPERPGRAVVWIAADTQLIAGEEAGELASYLALVDTANGVAVREDPKRWMFPNVDLTVHLYRRPRGRWVGLDVEVSFGPDGRGLTSSVLHDIDGPVGRAEQILTVRPLG